MQIFLKSLLFSFVIFSCSGKESKEETKAIKAKVEENITKISYTKGDLNYSIIRELVHNTNSYTQGLFIKDGVLYESSGGYGKSKIMSLDAQSGDIISRESIPFYYFAEGIELIEDKIFMLTWREQKCLVLDISSFAITQEFPLETEGWGICYDGNTVYVSSGTNVIQKRDPATFSKTGEISVYDNQGFPLNNLNELEFIAGEIFANVWMQDRVVRIDPKTGEYIGEIDFSNLRNSLGENRKAEAFNGIAFDEMTQEMYVTGKNWSKIFVVKLER